MFLNFFLATVNATPSVELHGELLRDFRRPTSRNRVRTKLVGFWLIVQGSTERKSLSRVVASICFHFTLNAFDFKEIGWNCVICTALIVLPEANVISQLCLHQAHLLCCVHMIGTTKIARSAFQLVSCLIFEARLGDLRDALLNDSACDRWHIEKEAE